jgi:apolipoprotein N-acyltransferase
MVATSGHWRSRIAGLLVVTLVLVSGGLLRLVPVAPGGQSVNVGMVQGNVDGSAGPRSMGYALSVTNNHMGETAVLMAKVRTGQEAQPDFILWPENASDRDPVTNKQAAYLVETASEVADLPILVGAVSDGPGADERQTSALWWEQGKGVTQAYYKQNVVPFGEFTPLRSLFFKLFPVTKEVGRQSVPGTKPGAIPVTLPDGRSLVIGDIICYELAFDNTVYETVQNGAQIITVQSNNATYTGSWQPRQQFAITRVRAMEMRREIVVATTSSLSGLIDARGRVLDVTQEGTAASHTYTVPERTGVTWGVRDSSWIELGAALIGLVAAVCGVIPAWRRRGN